MKITPDITRALGNLTDLLESTPPIAMLRKRFAEAMMVEVDRHVGAALDARLGAGAWSAADLGKAGRLTSAVEHGFTVFRLDGEQIACLRLEFDEDTPGMLTGRVIMASAMPSTSLTASLATTEARPG